MWLQASIYLLSFKMSSRWVWQDRHLQISGWLGCSVLFKLNSCSRLQLQVQSRVLGRWFRDMYQWTSLSCSCSHQRESVYSPPNLNKTQKTSIASMVEHLERGSIAAGGRPPIKRRGVQTALLGRHIIWKSHPLNCYWFLPLSECRQKNKAVKDLLTFDAWNCSKGVVLRMGLCKKKGVSFIEVGF